MNCKCRNKPFVFILLALSLYFLLANVSLSIQVTKYRDNIHTSIWDIGAGNGTIDFFSKTGSIISTLVETKNGPPSAVDSSRAQEHKKHQQAIIQEQTQEQSKPIRSTGKFSALTNTSINAGVGPSSVWWLKSILNRRKTATAAKTSPEAPSTGNFLRNVRDRATSTRLRNQRAMTRVANKSSLSSARKRKYHKQLVQAQKQQRFTKFNQRRNAVASLPIEPLKASLATDASFAACLLIKDDNDMLSEWIAYHYHTVKMRYLVVAVDPLSSEKPHDILKAWSNFTDLRIRIWNDDDFMPADFLRTKRPPTEYLQTANDLTNIADSNDENLQNKDVMLEISNHRYRQRIFLNSCMKHVRDNNRTWVMHIDTDEYIVPSKLLRQMNPSYLTLPDIRQPGSVLNLIQQVVNKTGHLVNYPCISMQRVLFGSRESEISDTTADMPSDVFDPTKFETLRWRYHALLNNSTIHGNPKVILDVAAIPSKYFEHPEQPVYSIHRPVMEYCPKNTDLTYSTFRKQPLAVNHYLGSWGRYSGRNDKRRSRIVYENKAHAAGRAIDDPTRPWLSGFVDYVGIDIAKTLLNRYRLPVVPSMNMSTYSTEKENGDSYAVTTEDEDYELETVNAGSVEESDARQS